MMNKIRKHLLSVVMATAVMSVAAEENEYWVVDDAGSIPELDCVIQPSDTVDVGSAVSGVVESIHVHRSDLINKGDILVELESSVEQATLELARTRAQLNTSIRLRQEGAAFGSMTQQRNQELLQKAVISQHEMDQLRTETRMAELQVRQEKDNKRLAGLEYRRADAVLAKRTIRSPVTGVVMERFKAVGEYVEDGPLLRVAQLDPLHVEVIVSVDYLGRIVPGMKAEVTLNLMGSGTHLATVQRVDRVADAASGTYGVRLSLANPEYKIAAGLRCRVNFLPPEQMAPKKMAVSSTDQVPLPKGDLPIVQTTSEMSVLQGNTSTGVVQHPGQCYTAGPFEDEDEARQLFAGLEVPLVEQALRNERVKQKTGYYVAVKPVTKSVADELAFDEGLKSVGVVESFKLSRGKYKGWLSLGFYNHPGTAVKLQKKLAVKGIDSKVIPLRQAVTRYWVDLSVAAGGELPGQLPDTVTARSPDAKISPVACSTSIAHLTETDAGRL
ncbi:efflux RND transporter periplasmic adaptor subunit [Amphritea sp. HPY]|uniref:efflux RND transporter periplasmic adaptor subunit n=1 Tax=Amphritea sp. HPY TaxID=3421652 RepID=UPI003D7ECAEC